MGGFSGEVKDCLKVGIFMGRQSAVALRTAPSSSIVLRPHELCDLLAA